MYNSDLDMNIFNINCNMWLEKIISSKYEDFSPLKYLIEETLICTYTWAWLGTWNLKDLWELLLNCFMCPQQQYQSCSYRQTGSVEDCPKSGCPQT